MNTKEVISQLTDSLGSKHAFRIERGVQQAASLWRDTDGSEEDFAKFCKENFVFFSINCLWNLARIKIYTENLKLLHK